MQSDSQGVSFLIMVAIMFIVTALEALARRRKTQGEIDSMGDAEAREEIGSMGDAEAREEAEPGGRYGEETSPREVPAAAPPELEATELGALAERVREESRRELREATREEPPELEPLESESPAEGRSAPATVAPRRRSAAAASLIGTLRGDRDALRRAVLHREILGPPVAMREGGAGWEEPGG